MWVKPWAAKQALYLSMEPLGLYLSLYTHDISMSRRCDKLSGIILQKSSVFILHGKNPMLIFGSLCEGSGFNNFMNHEQ